MFSHPTPKQIECLEAAAHCIERAQTVADPVLIADFAEMAHHWEWLARSYGYNAHLRDFIAGRKSGNTAGEFDGLRSARDTGAIW